MLELLALAIALVGGFAAGIWDIKTSDIPDEVPVLMAVLGLFLWYTNWLTTGISTPLIVSAVLGTLVFALGWGLYRAGQWGGGDAALLAGIVYLIPNVDFLATYLLDFLLVAIVYSIIYSIALGLKHPEVFGKTMDEIRKRKLWVIMVLWFAFGAAALNLMQWSGNDISFTTMAWITVFGLIIFYAYAKAIESGVFRRSVPVTELKVGDVLASSRRWEGITTQEIEKLRGKRVRAVEIKEGIRFGLVFPIALVAAALFGNIMLWLLGLA